LAYLHAWDVLRMKVHQQSVGQPAPYTSAPLSTSLLVATASEQNGVPNGTNKPENGPDQKNGIHPQQTVVANGRPVTRVKPMAKLPAQPMAARRLSNRCNMAMGHWLTGKI